MNRELKTVCLLSQSLAQIKCFDLLWLVPCPSLFKPAVGWQSGVQSWLIMEPTLRESCYWIQMFYSDFILKKTPNEPVSWWFIYILMKCKCSTWAADHMNWKRSKVFAHIEDNLLQFLYLQMNQNTRKERMRASQPGSKSPLFHGRNCFHLPGFWKILGHFHQNYPG